MAAIRAHRPSAVPLAMWVRPLAALRRPAARPRGPAPAPQPLASLPPAALLLVALLAGQTLIAPAVSAALTAPPAIAAAPQASAPRPQAVDELRDSGSFHRGKVRILGIPVITVASPVVSGSRGPTASQRAKVIEGNLELLYRAQEVCSTQEGLAELLIDQIFLTHGKGERACDSNQLGLLGQPEQLRVEVAAGSGDLPVLQARVPGRDQPLALLSVTAEDARLNGTTPQRLAERWRELLERRLRLARRLLEPGVLLQRFRFVALSELLLAGLLFAVLLLWRRCSTRLRRLEREESEACRAREGSPPQPGAASAAAAAGRPADRGSALPRRWIWPLARSRDWRRATAITWLHLLSRALLALVVVVLLPLMVGVAILAVPGQIALAIQLLLQPFGVVGKLLLGWLLAQLLRSVLAVLLRQWHSNPMVAPEGRARRDQRYRSLLRVSRRLVNLFCVALAAVWVLVEIPGVRDISNNALLASGALLGALALVFQDLLRDFVAGLMVLLEDRYAIGDQITIEDLSGEVIDVSLFGTELRSGDQRVMVIPNSRCKQVINATKLRSGKELHLPLAHRGGDPRRALEVIAATLDAFAADPAWSADLSEPPQLLGLNAVTPQGLEVALLLITRAGRQGPVERELRLRLVEALQAARIPLADGIAAGMAPAGLA